MYTGVPCIDMVIAALEKPPAEAPPMRRRGRRGDGVWRREVPKSLTCGRDAAKERVSLSRWANKSAGARRRREGGGRLGGHGRQLEQHVARLEVAVDHAVAVQVRHAARHVGGHAQVRRRPRGGHAGSTVRLVRRGKVHFSTRGWWGKGQVGPRDSTSKRQEPAFNVQGQCACVSGVSVVRVRLADEVVQREVH